MKKTNIVLLILGIVVFLFVVGLTFFGSNYYGSNHMWNQGYFFSGWMMPLGMIGMVAFWIFIAYVLFRWTGTSINNSEKAESHLKERLSRGEITIQEYEEILKKIASLLLKQTGSEISAIGGTFDSSKGDFRKVNVRAGISTFINYQKVPERVRELLIYINDTIEKISDFDAINKLAFDVHFQLVSIHPFADGNGRISRLLMNYVQQYHHVPLSVIYKEDRQEYFNALVETRVAEDISIFRKFMFLQTEKYLLEKIEELSKKQVIKKSKEDKMSFLF